MNLGDILGRPAHWANVLGLATLAGLEFGLIGPFGSYAASPFTRIVYWTALFWVGSLLLWPSVIAALLAGRRRGFPPAFSAVAAVLIGSIPLAALGAAETYIFWPMHASGIHLLDWYGLTIVVALPAIAGLLWLQLRSANIPPALLGLGNPPAARPTTAPVAIALPQQEVTVPDHLLATALCLQMEDHHVRIHLHGRSHLHIGVLRDVVATMDEGRGLQVHRSWWVARDAVRDWQQDGRAVTLELVNGLRVPVARNRVATLREQGWLEEAEAQLPVATR